MSVLSCPQCGHYVEMLHEGCCENCWNENQAALDRHNAEYEHWQRMSDEQRDEAIRRSYV